jgi:argininosuccinate lyase
LIAGAELQTARINARLDEGFLDATALMEYLIKLGVPMRTGHETVGRLVAICEKKNCSLGQLPLAEMQSVCQQIGPDVSQVLGTANAVAALQSYGSGGKTQVADQLARWKEKLGL